jgi:hypothetical protein
MCTASLHSEERKPGVVVVHTCDPCTWEAEGGGPVLNNNSRKSSHPNVIRLKFHVSSFKASMREALILLHLLLVKLKKELRASRMLALNEET